MTNFYGHMTYPCFTRRFLLVIHITKMSTLTLDLSRRTRAPESTLQNQNVTDDDIFDEDVTDMDVGKKEWTQMNWKLTQVSDLKF